MATNVRLREREDGELELIADIELWNDQLEFEPGGMSIAFTAQSEHEADETAPDVEILINPLNIPLKIATETLQRSLHNEERSIRLIPLHQKGLDTVTIAVISFLSASIAQGFFRAMGADLWQRLKAGLYDLASRTKAGSGSDQVFHCKYTYQRPQGDVDVIVVLHPDDMKLLEGQPVDIDKVHQYVENAVGSSRIIQVVVQSSPDAPYWKVVQIVDYFGKLISL